uniref:Uncharacterized protein n=1 Tax=Anopheles quadriannulatus TaxID=34691 RepID=A0A3F2Z1X7_ANOQN
MPVGNVSYYHRRKYSPQAPPDHQSRIFFGDYARPDGGSERSRSNGSISSVATTQSSSSCVSVHSSAASLADAANANLLAVVSAPKGVESDSSPVPKCVDSAGSCGGAGGIGTTTTTTTTTPSGSNCCVRAAAAAAAAGESGSVGASQQVPSSRTCASESATGYEGQRGTVVRAGGSYHSGGGGIGVVNSGNISGNGQQRRVAGGANSSNSSGGGSVNSTNKGKDQANGQLLLSPAGAGTTSSATCRSAPLQPVKSASFAVAGSGLLAGGSLAPGGTSYSQVSSSTFGTSRLGNNEEQRSQLSPGKCCILSMLCCVKIRRSYFDKMLIISYGFQ